MTVEEFQKQWQQMESDKVNLSKEDFDKKYSGKKTEAKWNDGSGPWHVGEWRSMQYNGHTLLKYCRAYFDIDAEVIVRSKPMDGSKHRFVPMFNRWWIVTTNGQRELWSGYRIRGAAKDDEGKPFKMLYDIGDLTIQQVESLIDEGTFKDWSKTSDKAPKTYIKQKKFDVTTIGDVSISKEYDGVSILVLMAQRPKGNYNYFLNMILHEGGSVDENGIIHKNPNEPDMKWVI